MRETLRERFPEMVVLFVALGFFVTLAELLLMGHTEGVQAVAPLAAGVGVVGAGLGLVAPRARSWALALLLGVSLAGLFGLVQHLEEGLEGKEGLRPGAFRLVDEEGAYYPGGYEEYEKDEKGEGAPPPLAPLSLAGLGLLGAAALWVRRP
ncbi:hypothetical protein [Thermus filiformis]|uniref:Uncharacterized protein n=1 Tax=Thermus filiformis TaxID=276 RepID=A0A0A2WUU4_THEFI|nr:hypothetical protein [Thermus filiformis]KGQ22542.1 hypothetical protein THFILI_02120 [Thermus filiformis]